MSADLLLQSSMRLLKKLPSVEKVTNRKKEQVIAVTLHRMIGDKDTVQITIGSHREIVTSNIQDVVETVLPRQSTNTNETRTDPGANILKLLTKRDESSEESLDRSSPKTDETSHAKSRSKPKKTTRSKERNQGMILRLTMIPILQILKRRIGSWPSCDA